MERYTFFDYKMNQASLYKFILADHLDIFHLLRDAMNQEQK